MNINIIAFILTLFTAFDIIMILWYVKEKEIYYLDEVVKFLIASLTPVLNVFLSFFIIWDLIDKLNKYTVDDLICKFKKRKK